MALRARNRLRFREPPRLRLRRRLLWIALLLGAVICALLIVRYTPRPPLAAHIASSTAVLDSQGRPLRFTMAADEQYRLWTPLDQVSPVFLEALLLHEDQRFYSHPGVDPRGIARAAFANHAGIRQGGSTITMQLARLMYGLNTRSIGGKLRQARLAIGLEMRYSKRELLETHVNLLPYGGNVQGIGAASMVYFGKAPADLTLAQALALVVIPGAPASRSPRDGEEPQSLLAARARLFERWIEKHPHDEGERAVSNLPLRFGAARTLPFEAPHFSNALLAQRSQANLIHSTLDLDRQHLLERVLQAYVSEQERLGVRNAAALLVDTRDASVRASVGSAAFFDASISGQVNGTLAKRSPGSALKPFVYALAIDQGLIHPMSVLKDAPTSFGPFSPENFDGRFAGPLSATDALVKSRNVPAVALAARLAQPSFYQFLRTCGISRMKSERHYGLALALGGGEVTMEEAAMLYTMLASGGLLRPLRQTLDEPLSAGVRVLSEEAAFMTLEILSESPRPEDSIVRPRDHVEVAWKTGTSWGFRDAWSAGVFDHYALIVWVGNFDGSSNPAFVGIQAAAPLFFRIVDALQAAEPQMALRPARPRPAHVAQVEVCAASGELPNAECPRTVRTWFIPGRSPIRVSSVHRRIWIDARTGGQACPPFDTQFVSAEVFEFWPSDVLQLFAQAGMPRRRPPPPANCERDGFGGVPPHISTPVSNATYTVRAATMGHDTIPLAATADAEVRKLYWFVDDAYIGTSKPSVAVAWTPMRTGNFMVRAVDDRGRADSRDLRVALIP